MLTNNPKNPCIYPKKLSLFTPWFITLKQLFVVKISSCLNLVNTLDKFSNESIIIPKFVLHLLVTQLYVVICMLSPPKTRILTDKIAWGTRA
ncbi:hypothetical protein MXB_2437 [Myxobolus squamalis]|nr:hypothetical protein MXB_2437 [Myxobolus squamalis]